MDEYKEDIGYLYIILIGATALILIFLINYYHLYQFRECYYNNFKDKYCEKYKDKKY